MAKRFYSTTIRIADTSGFTKQACSVRDARPEIQDFGIPTLGISPDGAAAQKKFDNRHSLPFPLVSDPDHKVAELYGAKGEKKHGLFDGQTNKSMFFGSTH
jgi:thioredoxin-dependent peroxiredoxin